MLTWYLQVKNCGMQGLKVLAPVVRKLGPRANPATLKEIPTRAIAVWLFYAGEPILRCKKSANVVAISKRFIQM